MSKKEDTLRIYRRDVVMLADIILSKAIKVDENLYTIPEKDFEDLKKRLTRYKKIENSGIKSLD